MTIKSILAAATILGAGAVSYAAIDIDGDGLGFVGKGDVQLAFGWTNKQLQDCANHNEKQGCLSFFYSEVLTSSVTDASEWTCTNSNNANEQHRSRTVTSTTTTSKGGVRSAVARVKNQVTGFNLNGATLVSHTSDPVVTVEGNQPNSCPTNWTLVPGSLAQSSTPSVAGPRTLAITDVRGAGITEVVELP